MQERQCIGRIIKSAPSWKLISPNIAEDGIDFEKYDGLPQKLAREKQLSQPINMASLWFEAMKGTELLIIQMSEA